MEKSTITAKAAAAMASAASVSSKVKPARGLLRPAETAGFKAGSPPTGGYDGDSGAIERPTKRGFRIGGVGGGRHRRFPDFQRPFVTADVALLAELSGIVARRYRADQRPRDQHGLGFLTYCADSHPGADEGTRQRDQQHSRDRDGHQNLDQYEAAAGCASNHGQGPRC